jgi:hypothetical protein
MMHRISFSIVKVLTTTALILLTCCKKDEIINEGDTLKGLYEGYFAFRGDTIWEQLYIKADTFMEVPSGGLEQELQKWPCITEGRFQINDDTILFDVLRYPPSSAVCDQDILLSGKYLVSVSGELLNFRKGEGNLRQTYNLHHVTAW